MTARRRPTVAVVGAGIAGLAAAWELVVASERAGTPAPIVRVLESGGRPGGKLESAEFAGRTVDLAADAFLSRRPEATELCEELGLTEQLVPVGASGASIWARGRLRAMPAALNLGVPTRWWPLARSGILSPVESLAVVRDLVIPHPRGNAVVGDRSVGEIVGERLGRPVVDRLVDPLIGGINAGGVDDLSAAATMPVLIAAALQPGSLMHQLGRVRPPAAPQAEGQAAPSPVFWSLTGSTAGLAEQLAEALIGKGVTIQTDVRVDAVEQRRAPAPGSGRWALSLYDTGASGTVAGRSEALLVDGVVLAVPATEAAVLLAPLAPMAAGILSTVPYASVAVITMSLARGSIRTPRSGTGFLVPRTSTIDGLPALITGCTYLDLKWPHLSRPDDELIRVSVGRYGDDRHRLLDDDQLAASVFGELARVLDIRGAPLDTLVTRWDEAFPQYRPGHLIKVANVEEEVAALGGLAVAGAALRGVGIPACIGSGRSAARLVLASLPGAQAGPAPPTPPEHGMPLPASPNRARDGGSMTPDTPLPTSVRPTVPVAESSPPPRWRPSRVRMTSRRDTVVQPRRGMVAVPSLLAGVGLALSLPPWGWWILAFPSAGLLWWRLGGLRPRTRLWSGYLAGLGCYVPGLMWVRAFSLPGAVVLIALEALFIALACLVVPARPVLARALVFPAAMTLAEAVRMTWPFGGLPLGGVFLGQADGPVLGVARLGGPLGLTLAVYLGGVAVGALAEAAVRAVRDGARARTFSRTDPEGGAATAASDRTGPGAPDDAANGRGSAHLVADAVAGLGALAAVGAVALLSVVAVAVIADHAPDGGPSVGQVTTAAVQGGGARGFRKSQINPSVVLAAQMSTTRLLEQLDHGVSPQLVLWPEDVVSLDTYLSDSPEQAVLSTLARTLHSTLVVGVTETVSSTAFRNEIVAFGPDGSIVSNYEKVHRVPFGEYVPYRSFFAHLGNLSSVPLDAIPGTGTGLLPTPAAPLGAMISYEVFYANRGRPSVRNGAQLLIVPTNTSSYAAAQVPTQEIAASEVQAVQQGRDLLQAAPTGYSAAFTNRGVLVQRSVLGARQVILATLSRRVGWTVYVRYGDLPVLVLAALAAVSGWLVAGRRRTA